MPRPRKRSVPNTIDIQKNIEMTIQVAQLYYKENFSKKDISQELGLRDNRAVNEYLEYGRKQGIINISIGEESGIYAVPQRNPGLESELLNIFAQLDHAIVAELPTHSVQNNENAEHRIHQTLGRTLAEELQTLLRAGDHIGVTGGRAIFACAQAIRLLSQTRAFPKRNVITSLAGGISRSPHLPSFELLSADNVAVIMSAALPGAIPRLLSVPWVAFREGVSFLKYPSERFILEEEWKQNRKLIPDIAIMGVGILRDESHPFFYEDKLELEPIKNLITELKRHIRDIGYDAVGDFGQRFFVIASPDEYDVKPDKLIEIEGLINEINAHLIAPTFAQLSQIDAVIVIAGGKHKSQAIWTVLAKPDIWPIHRLCTDSETAQWLIRKKNTTSEM